MINIISTIYLYIADFLKYTIDRIYGNLRYDSSCRYSKVNKEGKYLDIVGFVQGGCQKGREKNLKRSIFCQKQLFS